MKNKSIDQKIKAFIKLIKSLNEKYAAELTGQTKMSLQALESDLTATINLQKDLKQLKDTVRVRKDELIVSIKRLKKGSKEVVKARKRDKKETKAVKKTGKQTKQVPSEIPDRKNANVKIRKSI